MSNIYELTGMYLRLQNYINDSLENEDNTEDDLQMLVDMFDSINDGIDAKLEGTIKVIKHLQYDADAYKAEEVRMAKRRKTLENSIERLKNGMKMLLEATEQDKVKAGLFNVSLRKNPASVYLYNESKLPEKYLIPQEPKVDKKGILADLKIGIEVEGAVIAPETKALMIK